MSMPSSFLREHSARTGQHLGVVALMLLLVAAAALAVTAGAERAHAADGGEAPTVEWVEKAGNIYCKVDGALLKDGVRTVNGKKYLFDKKGVQLTSWHKVGKSYYYFTPKTKAKGSMVTGKVVNGIRLDAQGRAVLNDEASAELKVLTRATAFVEKYTKATWSQKKKLRASFDVLVKKYPERAYRGWTSRKGWHRLFAMDVLGKDKAKENGGSCYSFGAAFAYIANAIGCKSCKAVSSGGHGWAEVDGKVYDPEWSKNSKLDLFAFSLDNSGRWGSPGYKHGRAHVVTIAPRTKAFKGSSAQGGTPSFAGKNGLVAVGGKRYYVQKGKPVTRTWKTIGSARYYFQKDGAAATGPAKIKGAWYVFDKKGRLLTGKKTRVVAVAGQKYRVTKGGKAKPGWDAGKKHRFAADGRMYTGNAVIGDKFFAFSAKGAYSPQKTQQLRSAAKLDADAAPLLALLGKPSKASYSPSCYMMVDENGNDLFGQDGVLTYGHFAVYTFKADNGIEYYRGAEEH